MTDQYHRHGERFYPEPCTVCAGRDPKQPTARIGSGFTNPMPSTRSAENDDQATDRRGQDILTGGFDPDLAKFGAVLLTIWAIFRILAENGPPSGDSLAISVLLLIAAAAVWRWAHGEHRRRLEEWLSYRRALEENATKK